MYPWAYTWNPIGGPCLHACDYCYVGRLVKRGVKKYSPDKEPYLLEKELKTNLTIPDTHVLFVCSCYDMFGSWVPNEWIEKILARCREFLDTTFLFQSKNPANFFKFKGLFPQKTILGVTLETNRNYEVTKAPAPVLRYQDIMYNGEYLAFRWMVSIEPVMNFDRMILLRWMAVLRPEFVSIGADSGENGLDEPDSLTLKHLISDLEKFTEVRLKKNLVRLL